MLTSDRDERAKAQLRALARVVGAPGRGGGLIETLAAIAEGVRSAFGFEGVIDLLDDERDVYFVRAGVGEGAERLLGTSIPRSSLEDLLQPRFEVIPDVYFIPHDAGVDWERLKGYTHTPRLEWGGEGRWHPKDACLLRLRTSQGLFIGILSVHSPIDQRVPDRSTFEMLRLFAVIGANAAEAVMLQGRMASLETEREIEELRRDLFRSVSHELRTPVTSICGLARVASRESTPDDKRREFVEIIEKQAEHLAEILNDLLTAERASAGGFPVSSVPVDVDDVIARAAMIVGVTADPRFHASESGTTVLADPTRLAQAVANLLSNSAKYALGKDIWAQAWTEGERVLVEVEDDGPGIPEAELERVFDPFNRGREPDGVDGCGLGLYVTRQLVESMGGRITCRSRSGVGTRFTIDLPSA